jgi:hypothetical protein
MRLLISLAVATAVIAPVSAATITYDQTITIDPPFNYGGSLGSLSRTTLPNLAGITLNAGDTFTGTLTFTNPVHVQWPANFGQGFVSVYFGSSISPSFSTNFSSTITLLGLDANKFPAANPSGPRELYTQYFDAGMYAGTETDNNVGAFDFSFTGVSFTIMIDSINEYSNCSYGPCVYPSGPPVSVSLDLGGIQIGGDLVTFDTVTTPEPAGSLLCGLGLSSLVWLKRRGSFRSLLAVTSRSSAPTGSGLPDEGPRAE